MATKSRARIALEAALEAASTAQEKSDIANRLSKLMERESRTRARKRRENAKQPPKPVEPRDDSNDPFELDFTPAPLPAQQPPAAQPAPAPPEPDEDEREAAELEQAIRKHGDGSTRVITAMNSPGATYWDPVRGGYWDDIDPRSSVGPGEWHPLFFEGQVVTSDTYSGGLWASEREQDEKSAEEAAWLNRQNKLYGR